MIGGEIALPNMGFSEIPISNVKNPCASASTALHLACANIKAGLCDVALAVGAEKMTNDNKTKSMAIFDGAWDVHGADELTRWLLQHSARWRTRGSPSPGMAAASMAAGKSRPASPFLDGIER